MVWRAVDLIFLMKHHSLKHDCQVTAAFLWSQKRTSRTYSWVSLGLSPCPGCNRHHPQRFHVFRIGNPKLNLHFAYWKGGTTQGASTKMWEVHPRKLTCPLKRDQFNRKYIFQPLIFRRHASFRVSMWNKSLINQLPSIVLGVLGGLRFRDPESEWFTHS